MKNIELLLNKIYSISNLPMACFGQEHSFCFGNAIKKESNIYKGISNKLSEVDIPNIYIAEDSYYGGFRDRDSNVFVIGPVGYNELKALQGMISLCFYTMYDIEIERKHIVISDIGENEIYDMKELDKLDYFESEKLARYTFEDEMKFMASIENGEVEQYLTITDIHESDCVEARVGLLADNHYKHVEYLAVTSITLATRAAIKGGLDVMSAYGLSDLFLRKLEKCTKVAQVYDILNQSNLNFAMKVREAKNKKVTPYVEKCKVYISRHKNKKFTIDDIAENIGISKAYISKLFLQEVGITIHQYTINLRIEMGANLLKNTEESITAIAEYLCFNSQSQFGKIFKEKYGVTPQKYRNENEVIDFIKK